MITMDTKKLTSLGLTPTQAEAYLLLIESGKITPASLTKINGLSRTNAYMVLDRLVELGLAFKDEKDNKLIYRPNSPIGLQALAEKQRQRAANLENNIKNAMPELLSAYHSKRQQPGVRFVQGRKALLDVYEDHVKTGEDVFVFRSKSDDEYFGEDLYGYLEQKANKGIRTELISPYLEGSVRYAKKNDEKLKRKMMFVPLESYDAPVEISVYGSKVSMISFGEEAIATIIESPQIALAMRQIFALAKTSSKLLDI